VGGLRFPGHSNHTLCRKAGQKRQRITVLGGGGGLWGGVLKGGEKFMGS